MWTEICEIWQFCKGDLIKFCEIFANITFDLSQNNQKPVFKCTKLVINTTNIKSEMRSFKSNENIHKKEGGSYYVVSANKASSVTL